MTATKTQPGSSSAFAREPSVRARPFGGGPCATEGTPIADSDYDTRSSATFLIEFSTV